MKATVSTKSVTESTVMNLSDPDHVEPEMEGTVKFKVAYPKDFKGKKYWNDGDIVETSQSSASSFEERGLGKVVAEKETKVSKTKETKE